MNYYVEETGYWQPRTFFEVRHAVGDGYIVDCACETREQADKIAAALNAQEPQA